MTTIEVHKPLGQLLRRPPRYGINAAAVPLSPGILAYIRITDIDDSGRFSPNPKVGVAHPSAPDYLLDTGELVFARTGASVGKSYLYDLHDGELVFAGFLINISPDSKQLNPKYLSLFAQTKEYWDWIARTSVRSGQPGVNGREYAQLLVPLPAIATQNAIATTMTDVDDLIAALERLIAKKQAIKLGIMQQLLTGKTRLPGFSATWSRTNVGHIAEVKTGPFGSTLHERDYVANGTPIITVEHLGERGVSADQAPMVSDGDRQRLRAFTLHTGDIVFSRVGSIDRNAMISDAEEGWLFSGRLLRVRFDNRKADSAFMSAQFHAQPFREAVRSVAVGQTMPSLNTSILRGIPVDLPPLDEQTAIGVVTADLNQDLDASFESLAKAQAIKQSMMQQLLTGRTRLPVTEPADE